MVGSGQLLVVTGQTGLAISSLGVGSDDHVVKLGRGHHPDIGELPAHGGDTVNNGGGQGGAAATGIPPNNHTAFPAAYSTLTKEKTWVLFMIIKEKGEKEIKKKWY